MRRVIGAIAAPLIAGGALAGTGAVILHRAVPAELHDHLLGVGAALVIIGLLAATPSSTAPTGGAGSWTGVQPSSSCPPSS